ncbi:MAG: hypothetical protein ACRYGC_14940, partial [Janthinobacterium lividum]
DMDVPGVLRALGEVGFAGLVCVELSRESHRADTMVPQSLAWLRRHVPQEAAPGSWAAAGPGREVS